MRSAIEAFLLLPRFYFEMIVQPGFLGAVRLVPLFGTICLVLGLGLAAMTPRRGLLAFLLPVLGCGLLAVVIELGGKSLTNDVKEPLIWSFLLSHLALIGYLVHRLREVWQPALALALFSLTYVLFTTVVASLSNTSFR